MRNKMITNEDKLKFIIHELDKLIGLEFIDDDEIEACNLAIKCLNKELITCKYDL